LLLGSSVGDDNLTLTADLTNPDIFHDGHIALQRGSLHIARTAYSWKSTAHQRIAICNHSEALISFTLALTFGVDFADLFEVRSDKRERRGHLQEIVSSETDVAFARDSRRFPAKAKKRLRSRRQ
jgi:glycogen debranching enzyme